MNNVGRESDKSRTQGALRADNLSNAVILDGTVAADVENNLYGSIDAQKSEGGGGNEIWGYSRAEIADAIKGGDKLAYGLAGNAPEVLAANPANDPGGARNSGHNHGNNDHNRDFRKRHRARKRNQSQSAWHGAPTAACTNGFGNITNTRSLHRGAPHA